MDLKDFSPAQRARMQVQPSKDRRTADVPVPVEKRSKYRNLRCEVDGEKFDSRHEADMWLILKSRQMAGDISELRRQVDIAIYVPVFGQDGKALGVNAELCIYRADFQFRDKSGKLITMDSKGQRARIQPYPLKAKALMLSYGIEIVEV